MGQAKDFATAVNDTVTPDRHPGAMTASFAALSAIESRFTRPGRRASTRARRREEQMLADALHRQMLHLTHAPRCCLRSGEQIADEATLAWPRSFRAGSSAASALAVIHDPTLADALGRWMLAADHGGGSRRLTVSLLLPTTMRRDASLVDVVLASLDQSGLAPRLLELRFVEAALLASGTETLLCLSALRDAGVGIAVDDWGRRYGSLSMLRDVPLSTVRLDPGFTHDLTEEAENAALAAAVVGAAHALELQVVAQGVDNGEQRAALCRLGIDAVTGSHAEGGQTYAFSSSSRNCGSAVNRSATNP